jgi:hypothetical protein
MAQLMLPAGQSHCVVQPSASNVGSYKTRARNSNRLMPTTVRFKIPEKLQALGQASGWELARRSQKLAFQVWIEA